MNNNESLGLVVFDNHKEFGESVHRHLQDLRHTTYDFIVPIENVRFNTGEGKAVLKDSARGKDMYLISDVLNCSKTYQMRQVAQHMSPDDHFMDIIRVLGTMVGHAEAINLVMPYLYEARQHRKKLRESLDCSIMLHILEYMRVKNIITVDAHDPSIDNAIPFVPLYNYQPTELLLESLLNDYPDVDDIMVISPDNGAVNRADNFMNKIISIQDDVTYVARGFFYKQRDFRVVLDGKNPIKSQEYAGNDVDGKNVIIVDDMISSGASMLNVANELHERGAKSIYMVTTFAIFDHGVNAFNDRYDKGIINKVYATNASYIDPRVREAEWFQEVDISKIIAEMISDLHDRKSLEKYVRPKDFR